MISEAMACTTEMLASLPEYPSLQDNGSVACSHKQTMGVGRLNRTVQRTYVGRRSGCSQPVFILLLVLSTLVFVFFQMASLIPKKPAPLAFAWASSAVRDIAVYVRPNKTTSLLQPKDPCQDTSYVIVVPSAINNSLQRETIRRTWGQWAGFIPPPVPTIVMQDTQDKQVTNKPLNLIRVLKPPPLSAKLVFLLGTLPGDEPVSRAVREESERFGDVLVEDFVDSYTNLTLKSVFMLKYVYQHCSNSKYVIKVDDDIFLNIPNLQNSFSKGVGKSILSGSLICGAKPIHNQNSKWYTPRYMFREGKYPNYLSGTGYVMSTDLVKPLLDTAVKTPYFHLEDVFVTGICARKIGVRPTDNIGFSYNPRAVSPCVYKEVIMGHEVAPVDMVRLWNMLNQDSVVNKCHPLKKSEIRAYFPTKCDWR